MASAVIRMQCITNMHMGNGEINYNVIDSEVERDPITGYPNVNASGVKGALREFFSKNEDLSNLVDILFGRDAKDNSTQGQLKILDARLLAMPGRASKGEKAYYLVSSQTAMTKYQEYRELLLNEDKPFTVHRSEGDLGAVEEIPLEEYVIKGNSKIYLLSDADFRKLSLPVLARNKSSNGENKNLWYEEAVPYESIFYFGVIANAPDLLDSFITGIQNKIVQFGKSASIGYGLCRLSVAEE